MSDPSSVSESATDSSRPLDLSQKVKMIATDIDGTMLRSDGTLSPRVRAALHRAAAAGIHVVPATGRPMVVATEVIDALGINEHWVFANGAVTRHLGRHETVRAFWMDPDRARQLVHDVRAKLPAARFAMEFDTEIAYEPGFEHLVPNKPTVPPVDDVLSAVDGFEADGNLLIQKVLVFDPDGDIDELFVSIGEAVGEHGVASYSGLAFIEVGAQLVTKAMALNELCADLGVLPAEVVAFGDNHNDLAMLEWAGQGVAMANASQDALEAADAIIGLNDDDGLALAIEALLENQ